MKQGMKVVHDDEDIVRLVSKEWVVDGILQQTAFTLLPKESYISVNRPCIETFNDDVENFVKSHEGFLIEDGASYRRAVLEVGSVRNIKVSDDDCTLLNIDVDVEPRDTHTKSHAGIFVRSDGKNVKPGTSILGGTVPKEVSTDIILQDVRWELLELAELQTCTIVY